ncbi:hypothetical protein BC941DRAFT_476196 [Chlamydoabsidia padenii]|nr:hypothetical protein BC941DRAFT_476196 [Chlamydoabsidia padenii]
MLWERVLTDYNNRIPAALKGKRTSTALSNRWTNVINPKCSYFTACMTQVRNARHSGSNDESNEQEAKAMFLRVKKCHFNLMHCFKILSSHPKWIQRYVSKPITRPRAAASSAALARKHTDDDDDDDDDTMLVHLENMKQVGIQRNRLLKEKMAIDREQLRMQKTVEAPK